MCVRGINFASISTIFLLDMGTVATMWYFIVFHFYEVPLVVLENAIMF